MPTYDYECPKGHRFEVFQRMTDKPVAACPKCKGRARRVISGGAGFLFKGEGFYITDYRSDDYKKKASAESGSASEKSGKSDKPEKPAKAKAEGSTEKGSAKSKATKGSSEA
ncbi:MAG: FmdB family zinc ribbon protein [Longimicrobiales bacterium]